MYTRVFFAAELKEDTPKEVTDTIKWAMGDEQLTNEGIYIVGQETYTRPLPNHPLFQCPRWAVLFRGATNDGLPFHTWKVMDNKLQFAFHSELKNYGDELHKFLDWIGPYVEPQYGSPYGFYHYEESEPVFIHIPSED